MATTRIPSQGPLTSGNNFPGSVAGTPASNLSPRILTMSLPVLRNNSVMRSLVSTDYDVYAVEKGSSIDVPLPPNLSVSDVNPSSTPETGQATSFGVVSVPINEWKQAHFRLTDKEQRQIDERSFYDGSAAEAVSQLADTVDRFILSQYRDVYTIVGQQEESNVIGPQTGTNDYIDPFPADDSVGIYAAVEAGRALDDLKAYPRDRRFVGTPSAQARTLYLRQFTDASWMGSLDGVERGAISQKFGFSFHMSQNMPTHITRALADAWSLDTTSAHEQGATSVQLKLTADSTNPGPSLRPVHGDIMEITGQDGQTYVVTADAPDTLTATAHTAGATVTATVNISPPLRNAIAAAATEPVVTFKPSHRVNLAFHPRAFMFVTRPLSMPDVKGGHEILSAMDPLSGITLRLEIERQNKQQYYSYDILYGAALLRPELCVRVAGEA